MKHIQLDCPSCNQEFELDVGFAGSVCRCFACGMLMTVPKDSVHDQAEAMQRPESPELPVESAQGPRPEFPSEVASPIIFATASEKTLQVGDLGSIPTAPQNRVFARVTTSTLFFALTGVLVSLCLFGGFLLLRSSFYTPVATTDTEIGQVAYDRKTQVNPFRLDYPNFLGLPLQDRTVVLIDASRSNKAWLALVKEAIESGFTTPSRAGRTVGLIYATEEGGLALAESLQPLQDQTKPSLSRFQAQVEAIGQADLHKSLDQAIKLSPRRILLVFGRTPDPDVLDTLEDLTRKSTIILDVIMIDQKAPVPILARLVNHTGGQLVVQSQARIRAWFLEHSDAVQAILEEEP